MANLLQKLIFRSGIYFTIADADTENLKSLHTYLNHMLVEFEQNLMVQTIQNFELFDKNWLTIFGKVLTPIFGKRFLWTETIA